MKNFVLKMMNFVLNMMNYVLKMMNFTIKKWRMLAELRFNCSALGYDGGDCLVDESTGCVNILVY